MDKAKRARTAETPKQPSLGLKLRAPCLYPDRAYSAITAVKPCPLRRQLSPEAAVTARTARTVPRNIPWPAPR
jgi:hypothetical protein